VRLILHLFSVIVDPSLVQVGVIKKSASCCVYQTENVLLKNSPLDQSENCKSLPQFCDKSNYQFLSALKNLLHFFPHFIPS
jgi:hypothetical protein